MMKKVILVIAVCFSTAGLFAQTNPQETSEKVCHEDGVVRKNGKLMVIKDGQKTEMTQIVSLSDGSVVRTDGSITNKNGSTSRLSNGEHISMSGKKSKKEGDKKRDGNKMEQKNQKQNQMKRNDQNRQSAPEQGTTPGQGTNSNQ